MQDPEIHSGRSEIIGKRVPPKAAGDIDAAAGVVPSSPGKRWILLIDDSPAITQAIGSVLRALEIECIVANSGHRGREIFLERRGEIDLVMLDMNMPEMNGEQTLKALREIDPRVKVLITSSASRDEVRRRCAQQGEEIPHYLRKTNGIGKVVEKVLTVLEE